ncbi:MAG: hypothetical protein ABEH35_05640 [Haloarculaceae archaeon]
MKLPEGRLVRSRVVDEPRHPLADALDRELTGYAVLEPQDTLLLDGDGRGVLTFENGVPVVAYHTGSDRGGPAALADLAVPGPYHVELYAVDGDDLAPIHDEPAVRVPPGMPAERLAGDPALAASTRRAAPDEDRDREPATGGASEDDRADQSAVEAFLEDEEKIEAIRQRAREEASERAQEWGFDTV